VKKYVQKELDALQFAEDIKEDLLECIFVCKFDTRKGTSENSFSFYRLILSPRRCAAVFSGNIVEWKLSRDPALDLTSVEFKGAPLVFQNTYFGCSYVP
jgi:hypothetical protein